MSSPSWKKFLFALNRDAFFVSLGTFIVYSLLELWRPRFVTAYFNLNALLLFVIVTGIIYLSKDKN